MRFGRALFDPERVVQAAGVAPGMHVADFGCGRTGHIMLPAAHQVGGEGTVFAVDLVKEHLQMIESLCSLQGLSCVQPIWGDYERPGGVHIESGSLDRIFLVNNLSLLADVGSFVSEAKRLLHPDGRVVVVDWKKRFPHPVAPPSDTLYDLHDAELLFAQHGLQKVDEIPVSPTHWGLILS